MEPILFAGIILLILYFLLARQDFVKSIYYLIPLLPLDNRIYFNWGFERATPVRWALVGVILFFLFSSARRFGKLKLLKSLKELRHSLGKDKFLGLLVVVWLIRLLSTIWSLDFASSVNINIFFTEIVLLYLVLKKAFLEKGQEFVAKSLKIYFLTGVILALWSPVQYWFYKFQDRVLPGVWPLPNSPVRIGSLFWDINHYGAFAVTIVFLGVAYLLSVKRKKAIFILPAFLITAISLGMTLSRSAFIGFAGGFFVFICGMFYGRRIKQILLGLAVLLTILGIGFLAIDRGVVKVPKNLYERFFSLNFSYRVWDDSINAHSALILGSWQILEDNPVIGGGYGSFDKKFRLTPNIKDYFSLDPVEDAKIPAHSVWFEALSATGFVGAVPFYLLIGLLFASLYQKTLVVLKLGKSLSLIPLGVLCGLTAIFLSGIFYSYNLEFFFFFVFIALFLSWDEYQKINLNYKTALIITFLVTLAGSFIFYKLGRPALADWDESIYAQISHNILHIKGDAFALVWREDALRDGKDFWFEKPPLYIWLTSFTYFIFGVNEFAARFVSALAGVFGVLVVYFFGRKIFGERIGVLSAVVLATTTHWIFQSRNGTLDVLTSLWILCVMLFFWLARNNPKKWKWVGIFLGLTMMTKGPIVAIPIISLVIFVLLDLLVFKSLSYRLRDTGKIILWFLIIAVPWHAVEIIRFGKEFIDSYLFYHILERSRGIEGHQNDFWWYLIVLKVWFRQWFVILIPSLILGLFAIFARDTKREVRKPLLFLVVWSLVTFLVLSASSSKIQWYLIPIYPPLSIIVGWFLIKAYSLIEDKFKIFNFKFLVDLKIIKYIVFVLIITVASIFLEFRWKSMWVAEDVNRDIAVLGATVSELNDDPSFLPRKVPIYFYSMSPGPAYYYIQRFSRPVAQNQIEDMIKSPSGKAFMAMTKESSFKKLMVKYPNPHIMVYKKEGDYVLFGKDWPQVSANFAPQFYPINPSEYDPYFFEKELFNSKWLNE